MAQPGIREKLSKLKDTSLKIFAAFNKIYMLDLKEGRKESCGDKQPRK
jgi:hypothetical protein